MTHTHKVRLFVLWLAMIAGVGCGYSEEEMQVKQERIDQLTRALDALERKHADLQERFTAVATENASMKEQLGLMGMSVEDKLAGLKGQLDRFAI